MEITQMTVSALSQALDRREISAKETVESYVDQIQRQEEKVHAYLTLTIEQALHQAEQLDERRMRGERLPFLAGVPGCVKDNICTKGVRTTCASRMLEDFIPPYSAAAAERLEKAGAILLGKTNMDEFGMGSTTGHSAFGPTHNPWDLSRAPGGSSGGSAAAVAAGEAAFALGSDTGGSIRQPAAFCGVVGLKPTYGAVSRYGLIAFASSLDQIGPITPTVKDNALIFSAIAGPDPRDATCAGGEREDPLSSLGTGVEGMRIALPREYLEGEISPEVREAVLRAAQSFEGLGARVEEVSLGLLPQALGAYYLISSAEASSNLARYDGVRYGMRAESFGSIEELYRATRNEGFGREVKRRILLGTFALSAGHREAYYEKADQIRRMVAQDFARVFDSFQLILAPVAPTAAPSLGKEGSTAVYQGDRYTAPVNLAGLPALALPCGRNKDGLPLGMQLIGPAFSERILYQAGYAYEQTKGEGHR